MTLFRSISLLQAKKSLLPQSSYLELCMFSQFFPSNISLSLDSIGTYYFAPPLMVSLSSLSLPPFTNFLLQGPVHVSFSLSKEPLYAHSEKVPVILRMIVYI